MAYSGPLQVVPDIDDEDDDSKANSGKDQGVVPAPGTSDLEKKLLHLQSDMLTDQPKVRAVTRRRRDVAHTMVTRLNTDAQRMSAVELHWYRHLAELRTPQV